MALRSDPHEHWNEPAVAAHLGVQEIVVPIAWRSMLMAMLPVYSCLVLKHNGRGHWFHSSEQAKLTLLSCRSSRNFPQN